MKKIIFLLFVFSFPLFPFSFFIGADELSDIEKQLADLNRQLQMSISATKPLESDLLKMEEDLGRIKKGLANLEADLVKKKKAIVTGEEKLAEQEEIFAEKVKNFYKKTRTANFFLEIFSSRGTIGERLREMAYRQAATNNDKKIITEIVLYVKDLEEKKRKLEKEQEGLAKLKKEIDEKANFLRREIGKAKEYQSDLSGQIAGLTARQQALLAEKLGSFTTSVGDVPLADDPHSSPNFNPGFSPAFGAFSFGAPHRVGMSQYGAFGRAKAGQNAEEILKAYYSGVEIKKDYPVPDTITVDGYGRIPFEDLYLKGIAEMPSKWGNEGGMEALKAQAIAARTYALAATNNGQGTICSTESCQVFIGQNKGGKWEEAVKETRRWVIVKDNQPIKAWYASTAGGFTRSSADVWGKSYSYAAGIKDVTSGGSWPNDAYEGVKYGRSPWFYKGWYKPYRAASSTRSHPFLNEDEFADIINTLLLYQKDSGAISHLSQTDKGNGDTWSREKVREELRNRGTNPVGRINNLNVSYSNAGITGSVSLETDQGEKTFEGGVFKQIFNLRAPGEIHLTSSLYNLEKK